MSADPVFAMLNGVTMRRRSVFPLFVSLILTVYLVLATVWIDENATTPADDAAVRVVGVLAGALAIVAICLLIRWVDEIGAERPVSDDYRPIVEHEIDSN